MMINKKSQSDFLRVTLLTSTTSLVMDIPPLHLPPLFKSDLVIAVSVRYSPAQSTGCCVV